MWLEGVGGLGEKMCKVRGSKVRIGNLKENMNYMVNGPGWSRIDYIKILKIDYCPAVYYSSEHWCREQLTVITKKS